MPGSEEKPRFWSTIPGILTGVAAVLAAIPALVTALNTIGITGNPGDTAPKSPSMTKSNDPVFRIPSNGESVSLPKPVEKVNARYFCQKSSNGVLKTIAETPWGNIEVINWKRYVSSEWTPEERCRVVSDRFQKYSENGQISYITTGRMNGQNVICVANQKNGDCARQLSEQGLLFTVTSGKSPDAILLNLMGISRLENLPPINESNGDRVYVDINKFLKQRVTKGNNSVVDVVFLRF